MPRDGRRLVLVGLSVAKVKAVEPVRTILRAGGNGVQLIFHGRGEVIIHQLGEVFLQEAHHGEGHPRGYQGVTARDHVAAVLDRLDNGGIRRRAPDAQVLHLFHQAGFGIARRRVGGVAFCRDLFGLQIAAFLQVRQAVLALLARILVGAVSLQETREGNGAAGCRELDIIGAIIRGRGAGDRHLHGGALGIGHLRGHGALPNQVIKLKFLRIQLARQLAWGGKGLAGGADRLVRLLRVFDAAVINARGIRDVFFAINAGSGATRGVQALFGQ